MRRKLTLRCVLISLITAVIVFAAALGVVFWLYDETESDDIKDKTHLLTAALQSAEDPSSVLAAIDDTRVTLVDADGNVVYDSYGATDNHGDREEIIAAMNGEPEVVGRYSQTMGAHAYYYAEKFTAGGNTYVLRLCERRSDIGPYIGAAVGALVLAAAVGIAVSAVFARRMSGSISARLGEINNRLHALTLATPGTSAAGGDEFAEIAEEIDALVAGLGGSLADLRREQSKLDFVINNISQGMMAFSSHNEIVLYNKPVCKIFKVKDDIMGRHFSYLTKDEELKTLMHNALMRGEDGEFSYRLRGKDLNFKVYSFKTDDESGEIEHIVLVADLTKEKAAIRQKSEFFANASHELKTPLTTMQGLTEILLAKAGDEGQKKQLERIYKESKRLSFLVQDMLYISDLESGRAERRDEFGIAFLQTFVGAQTQNADVGGSVFYGPGDLRHGGAFSKKERGGEEVRRIVSAGGDLSEGRVVARETVREVRGQTPAAQVVDALNRCVLTHDEERPFVAVRILKSRTNTCHERSCPRVGHAS